MNIEKIVLKNLFKNEAYTRKVLPFIKDEYFLVDEDRVLFKTIKDFLLKFNAQPTFDALRIEIESRENLREDTVSQIVTSIKEFQASEEQTNIDWLVSSTEQFCQEKAIYNAIMKSIDIMNSKGKESKGAIPTLLSDALAISFDPNVGHDYLEQYDERYEYYHRVQEKIPFDLEYFNKITKGGLPKKTLNIVLSGTGVGKSLFMCHVAASCLNQGKNVLYITLELAEEEVAKRIDANLMNITFEDLMVLHQDAYKKKAENIKKKTNGKLIIKEYPTASASTIHFKTLLNELNLKKTFRPDIIFVDYLNICSSARIKPGGNVNSYTYIKSIAEELRGLAVEFEVPLVSATQTTRSGFCLDTETTFVHTHTGNIQLKNIKVGDELLSNNGVYNRVLKIYPAKKQQVYCITTESGKKIMCSGEHRFPTDNIETTKSIHTGLRVGDNLITI